MKLHIDFPWGGTFEMERQPIGLEKFYALCGLGGAALFVTLILGGVVLR